MIRDRNRWWYRWKVRGWWQFRVCLWVSRFCNPNPFCIQINVCGYCGERIDGSLCSWSLSWSYIFGTFSKDVFNDYKNYILIDDNLKMYLIKNNCCIRSKKGFWIRGTAFSLSFTRYGIFCFWMHFFVFISGRGGIGRRRGRPLGCAGWSWNLANHNLWIFAHAHNLANQNLWIFAHAHNLANHNLWIFAHALNLANHIVWIFAPAHDFVQSVLAHV